MQQASDHCGDIGCERMQRGKVCVEHKREALINIQGSVCVNAMQSFSMQLEHFFLASGWFGEEGRVVWQPCPVGSPHAC